MKISGSLPSQCISPIAHLKNNTNLWFSFSPLHITYWKIYFLRMLLNYLFRFIFFIWIFENFYSEIHTAKIIIEILFQLVVPDLQAVPPEGVENGSWATKSDVSKEYFIGLNKLESE